MIEILTSKRYQFVAFSLRGRQRENKKNENSSNQCCLLPTNIHGISVKQMGSRTNTFSYLFIYFIRLFAFFSHHNLVESEIISSTPYLHFNFIQFSVSRFRFYLVLSVPKRSDHKLQLTLLESFVYISFWIVLQ